MPGRRKKKSFRDVAKLGATHFEVGYRSQKDPMLADSETSEHVLVPKEAGSRESRLEEQMKYGIYYEDDYDYLQHLRDVKEIHESEMKELPGLPFQLREEEEEGDDDTRSVSMASTTASRLQIPSSVLGSVVERDVGLLNMAGPGEELDDDIAAALDDNFDFEDPDNVLEDDFMEMANAEGGMESVEEEENLEEDDEVTDDADEDTQSAHEDEKEKGEADEKTKDLTKWLYQMQLQRQGGDEGEEDSDFDSEEGDVDDNESEWTECSEDTQGDMSRVSKYSASMLPRNENLQLLDRMTEAVMDREFTWDKIGALEGEELSGRVKFDSDLFRQCELDLLKSGEKVTMKDLFNSEERVRPVVPKSWYFVEEKDYSVEEEIDYSQEPLAVKQKPEYDVESIRSTYSRGKNLPTKIVIPEEWLPKKKQKKKAETSTDAASESSSAALTLEEQQQFRLEQRADAAPTFRPKGETKEERKERKQAVKAQQKERRVEKKVHMLTNQEDLQRQRKKDQHRSAQKRIISMES